MGVIEVVTDAFALIDVFVTCDGRGAKQLAHLSIRAKLPAPRNMNANLTTIFL